MNKWIRFYLPFFSSREKTEEFVSRCEQLAPPNNAAKIMMHQTQRLVSIADELPRIMPNREALPLLFLIICAENIAKLQDGFEGDNQSKKYVRQFFETFLSQDDHDTLANAFTDNEDHLLRPLTLRMAIDLLYDVRCEVVHEGKYWNFMFHDGRIPMINVDPDVIAQIQFSQLRDIVVRGCICAIQGRLL